MGQGYFAGLRVLSPSYQGHLRDGMMRCPEGTLTDETGVTVQLSCDGVNLCGFQALCQREGREDGRQAFGQHRLATSRRTYHDQVMSSGSSYLQGTFDTLLSLDVREVEVVLVLLLVELATGVNDGRLVAGVAIHEPDDIHQGVHAIDLQLVDHGCLADVLTGNDESLELFLTGTNGNRQRTTNRQQASVQP